MSAPVGNWPRPAPQPQPPSYGELFLNGAARVLPEPRAVVARSVEVAVDLAQPFMIAGGASLLVPYIPGIYRRSRAWVQRRDVTADLQLNYPEDVAMLSVPKKEPEPEPSAFKPHANALLYGIETQPGICTYDKYFSDVVNRHEFIKEITRRAIERIERQRAAASKTISSSSPTPCAVPSPTVTVAKSSVLQVTPSQSKAAPSKSKVRPAAPTVELPVVKKGSTSSATTLQWLTFLMWQLLTLATSAVGTWAFYTYVWRPTPFPTIPTTTAPPAAPATVAPPSNATAPNQQTGGFPLDIASLQATPDPELMALLRKYLLDIDAEGDDNADITAEPCRPINTNPSKEENPEEYYRFINAMTKLVNRMKKHEHELAGGDGEPEYLTTEYMEWLHEENRRRAALGLPPV